MAVFPFPVPSNDSSTITMIENEDWLELIVGSPVHLCCQFPTLFTPNFPNNQTVSASGLYRATGLGQTQIWVGVMGCPQLKETLGRTVKINPPIKESEHHDKK